MIFLTCCFKFLFLTYVSFPVSGLSSRCISGIKVYRLCDKLSSLLDGDMPLSHPEAETALVDHRLKIQGLPKNKQTKKQPQNKEKKTMQLPYELKCAKTPCIAIRYLHTEN